MKIKKLILAGYKRFKLRQIHRLEYTPSKKTQVILGSNGSGKSSLLKELSPLPGLHTEFDKGGMKEIHIYHKGKEYRLISDFGLDGNRFIFEVDGENLNPGYTVTVYRELVKDHFNYTAEIHALITGQVTFHELSVNDRRNWFMAISDTDYTYALKYFHQLKQRVRDTQSALKHTQSRLSEEIEKCLDKEAELKLRIEIEYLRETLHKFLSVRPPRQSENHLLEQKTREVDASLETVINELRSLISQHETRTTSEDKNTLETLKNKLTGDYRFSESLAINQMQQIAKLQQKANEFSGVGNCSLEDISKEIRAIEEENNKLHEMLDTKLMEYFKDPVSAFKTLEWSRDYLSNLSEKLMQFKRRDYSRTEYQEHQQYLFVLKDSLQKFQQACDNAWLKVSGFENKKLTKEVECPSCNTVWIPDYDEIQHKQAIAFHQATVEARDRQKELVDTHEAKLEEMRQLFSVLGECSEFVSKYPDIGGFFAYIRELSIIEKEPERIPSVIELVLNQLTLKKTMVRNQEILEDRLKIKKILEAASAEDLAKLNRVIEEENDKLAQLQTKMREIQQEIKQLEREIEIQTNLQESYRDFTKLISERKKHHTSYIRDLIIAAMDEVINSFKLELSQKERQLNQIEIQKGLVESLSRDAETLAADLELLKMAQDELSPSSGLIAKGMSSFINSFVSKVNSFIGKIWLYPLEIIPVSFSGEEVLELDYKFEVSVNGEAMSPDIAKTSAGQKEIINLAFAAVCMRYLGLEDYPFFLDEFAVKMDAAHRKAAYEIIEYLIDSRDFSQLFLISHYEQGYSSLNDAEMLVLCDSNVVLPKHLTYNSHAVIQ